MKLSQFAFWVFLLTLVISCKHKGVNETSTIEEPPSTEKVLPPLEDTKSVPSPSNTPVVKPVLYEEKAATTSKSSPSQKIPEKMTRTKEKETSIQLEEVEVELEPTVVPEKENDGKKEIEIVPVAPSHEIWNDLLKNYVSSTGKVNYKGLSANRSQLESYLQLLAENPEHNSWSSFEKMAYWINAYNAFTVKLIVDNYPLGSIMELYGGKAWDEKWIKLGEKTYTLNNIEHDILRPRYKDARIHFAVNCAAQSCPPILNRAWTSTQLNSFFEQQARKFVNDPKFNQIKADEVAISKIFEWYAEDFGNIIDYLNKYSKVKINSDAKVTYLEYNWDLNE